MASDLPRVPALCFKGQQRSYTPLLLEGALSRSWELETQERCVRGKRMENRTPERRWGRPREERRELELRQGQSRGWGRGTRVPAEWPPPPRPSTGAQGPPPPLPIPAPPAPPVWTAAGGGAPAVLLVSDQPQGTDGEAWGAPSRGWGHPQLAGKVCAQEFGRSRIADIPLGSLGARRAAPRLPPPSFLAPRGAQGLPLRPPTPGCWDLGPALKRRKTQQKTS